VAVAAARTIGVDAHEGTLDSAPWGDASFDLVIMNHALEHMPDPVEQLRTVRRLLRDDGALVVAVPNWQSWQRRLFGTYWGPLEVPRHLTQFSPHALRLAAVEAGFTAGTVRNYTTGVGLPVSLWYSLSHSNLLGRRQSALLMAGAVLYPLTWVIGRALGGDATYLVARP
jgi:SAM-dependent methyltransferase